tara:strand:- start:1003 stop:1224 length:222 start_codon:yes stop_codon:yes gene_type:complete
MKTIELTDEEIDALIKLIDLAVKAGGLNVAQAASVLAQKLAGQLNPPPSEVVESPIFAEPADLEVVTDDKEED